MARTDDLEEEKRAVDRLLAGFNQAWRNGDRNLAAEILAELRRRGVEPPGVVRVAESEAVVPPAAERAVPASARRGREQPIPFLKGEPHDA